jgi:plasmid replication initiation protein
MVTDTTNSKSQLVPERHPQHDLFICDVADAVLKDVMQQMEHPFYSLSKKPETNVRRYEHNGNWLEVVPSVKGLATIYDKDILIYCISQIMHAVNKGEEPKQRVRINSRELLIFTNRGTSGRDYMALTEALERIRGTTISTNVRTGDEEQFDTFGLIETSSVRRKHGLDGRLLWCEVKLSDWVFNAIKKEEVLTLHRDYFRLRKPIERRVYELARKHCGQQPEWRISVPLLLKKSGSQSPEKRFRQMIKHLAVHDHLPDYHVRYQSADDMVIFTNRGTMLIADAKPPTLFSFVPEPSESARERAKAIAVEYGWDSQVIEDNWRGWVQSKGAPDNTDAAFVGFFKSWCEKRGSAR